MMSSYVWCLTISGSESPLWSETLELTDVILQGAPDYFETFPPAAVVEIWSQGSGTDRTLIGRLFVKPNAFTTQRSLQLYYPPPLKWFQVKKDSRIAGEILAMFELVQAGIRTDVMKHVMSSKELPDYIRPKTVSFKLEVLFWGLRECKAIKNPKIVITCGDSHLSSQVMPNVSQFPNFSDDPAFTQIEIPENPLFCPPVVIRLYSGGYYGTSTYVGNHVIRNIHQFTVYFEDKRQWKHVNDTQLVYSSTTCYDSVSVEWEDQSNSEPCIDDVIYAAVNKTLSEEAPLIDSLSTDRPHLPRRPGWFEFEPRSLWGAVKKTFRTRGMPFETDSSMDANIFESETVRNSRKRYMMSDPNKNPLYFDWWTKYYESIDVIVKSEERDWFDFIEIPDEERAHLGKTSRKVLRKLVKNKRIGIGALIEIGFEGKEKVKQKCRGFPCCCQGLRARRKAVKKSKFRNLFDDNELNRRKTSALEIHDFELEKLDEYEHFEDAIRSFNISKSSTQNRELEESPALAVFKGGVCIYHWKPNRFINRWGRVAELGYFAGIPNAPRSETNGVVALLARVYAVKAHHLHSRGPWTNSYINLETNSVTVSDRENVISHQNHPLFAKHYEINAVLPFDSILKVKVMNKDKTADELIGETAIDIENRFYSRHRGTCGLPQSYNHDGYNRWRDGQLPSEILETLCENHNLPPPRYRGTSVSVGKVSFRGKMTDVDYRECLALSALRNWHKIPVVGCVLVREHVETRALFNDSEPGIEQGKLEMWLDLFPLEGDDQAPPPIDITPRAPDEFELRVVVRSTRDVALKESTYFHRKHVDILVKGWIEGKSDVQRTDVHSNSLDGVGIFNWRFIFNFHHYRDDQMIIPIVEKKQKSKNEKPLSAKDKIPPVLHLQLWDNERIKSSDFLGSLDFNLHRIPKPTRTILGTTVRGVGAPIDLFERKIVKGTWEFSGFEDDLGKKTLNRTGLVEIELELLNKYEAQSNPAGLGRKGPNPLPEPERVIVKFSLFRTLISNPLRKIMSNVWKGHKSKIMWMFLTAALVLFVLLFIYSIPGALSGRLFNPR